MTHSNIFNIFKTNFLSSIKKNVKEWFPNGYGAIRIIFDDKSVVIFSYEDKDDWKIETIKSYLNKMKEGSRSGIKYKPE